MKSYKIITSITLVLAGLLITSCASFEEINGDPNRPTEVPTPNIMTMLQRNIAYNYYDSWQGLRMHGVIGQQWTQRTYTNEDRYDFSARTGTVANYFNWVYTYAELANKISIMIELDPITTVNYGDHKMQIATAEILKAWLMFQNVQTFGDVPYTEANDIEKFPNPKYDKQEFIYKDLIRKLKEINTTLQGVSRG